MTKTNKKLIVAIAIALASATAAGAGIHLLAGESGYAVSKDSAKEIALAHAGFAESDVTIKKVEIDRDHGRTEYEIEFRKDGVKYEYEIDAESGEIIAFDLDGKNPATTNADGTPAAGSISADDAKAAALAHAGLDASEVTFTKVRLDRDDDGDEYEVEFYKDNIKYEYDIDAATGRVLSYDKEMKKNAQPADPQTTTAPTATEAAPAPAPAPEPTAPAPVVAPETPAADQITAEEAKAIALAHAGVAEADVTIVKVELDRDDGRNEYEVDFRRDNVKYEYDIDAKSGNIVSYDREENKVASTTPKPEQPDQSPVTSDKISADEAKKLALAHAGLSEADVTFTKVKIEKDDGRTEYEIEFRQGRYEYEYEIDAVTGKIIDFEKDYDD